MDLKATLDQARRTNTRATIALEGDSSWLAQAYQRLRASLESTYYPTKNALILSSNEELALSAYRDDIIDPSRFKSCLGTEASLLVWDLCANTNADALAATSGTLTGGGLLITLAQPELLKSPSSQRWYRILRSCDITLALNPSNLEAALEQIEEHQQTISEKSVPFQLNDGQLECVRHIKHAASGHRNRPLVLRADRGRGKSTALGFAAAQLINEGFTRRIILASNHKASAEVLLAHFKQHLRDEHQQSTLTVMPCDAILQESPDCGLLLVDEAASIPLPMLEQILRKYSRVVMASTLHGYEGSGRGFDLKLNQILNRTGMKARFVSLDDPVRWAKNCPLERSINDAFLLNVSFPELSASQSDKVLVEWLRPQTLEKDEALIREVFSLLVLAHYQTRPSDLAFLLDNPAVHVALLRCERELAGVALCVDESVPEAQDTELAEDIISGRRRLKGRLLPQALAGFYADTRWLKESTLRVMRIVVHPDRQSRGFGTKLLKHVQHFAAENAFSGCSVSFGADARLLSFWQNSGYRCMRLSYKADASSGVPSVMLVNPLDESLLGLCDKHQVYFHRHIVSGLAHFYRNIDPSLLSFLLAGSNSCDLGLDLNSEALGKLNRFASTQAAPWDCWPELQKMLLLECSKQSAQNRSELEPLIRYLLMGDMSVVSETGGKKAWDVHLRDAAKALLANQLN